MAESPRNVERRREIVKKIRELKAYFDERSGLREINLMIEGLREYQNSGEDSPELSEGIAALEKESRTRAAALEAKAKEVRAAGSQSERSPRRD